MLLFIYEDLVTEYIAEVSIHLMLLFIPRFIGFSSSNSFYNTAKYKGLQDFYQPTSHFLFTQSKPGIPPYFQYFSFFYENPPGNFYNFSFNLLREFPCHVFTLTGEFFYYKIKSSPLSFFSISKYFFSKHIIIHQFYNTHKIFFLVYHSIQFISQLYEF